MAGESARESARRQRERAERLLRAAELNDRGAQGEERTAEVLAALPGDVWTVLHDVRWPGRRFANVDHVVIGPPGVFVIDSKNWSGEITVRDDVLRQNGYRREPAVAGAAEAALAIAQLTSVVRADVVRSVLCFVRAEEVAGWARDVMVCSTGNLLDLLQSRPERSLPHRYARLPGQLDAQLSAARSTPAPGVERVSLRPHRLPARRPVGARSPKTRSRRKKEPSWLGLLFAAVLSAVLILAPQVITGLGGLIAGLLVSQAG